MSLTLRSGRGSRRRTAAVLVGAGLGAVLALASTPAMAFAAPLQPASASRSAAATSYGACEITGTAKFTPGLTMTSRTVRYVFKGKFTNCHGSDSKITSGTVTARGRGSEACSNGTTKGVARVRWNDGQRSIIAITTTGVGNLVQVSGTVKKGTAFRGDSATGFLAFTTNPLACFGSGVRSTPFDGAGALS